MNREDKRGAASLAAARKTYSEPAVHTKGLFVFLCCQAHEQKKLSLSDFMFAWKETVHPQSGEPLGSYSIAFFSVCFVLFLNYIILRFFFDSYSFMLVGLVRIPVEHS